MLVSEKSTNAKLVEAEQGRAQSMTGPAISVRFLTLVPLHNTGTYADDT